MPLPRARWLLLLCLLLAEPLRAASLYRAPNAKWGAVAKTPLASFSPTSVAGLKGTLASADSRTWVPVFHELSESLRLTPDAFASLPLAEQHAALEMAALQASQDLAQKSYELAGLEKSLPWSKETATRAELDELYRVASQLRELDRDYGPLLGEAERLLVAESAARSAQNWLRAREAYIRRFGEAGAKALETDREGVLAQSAKPKPLTPGAGAKKLRERMKATKMGWGEKDFETLYVGYGFSYRDGAKHRMYFHPDFPQLHQTVSRQRELPAGYAQSALKLLAELEALSAPAGLDAQKPYAVDDELPPPPFPPTKLGPFAAPLGP